MSQGLELISESLRLLACIGCRERKTETDGRRVKENEKWLGSMTRIEGKSDGQRASERE